MNYDFIYNKYYYINILIYQYILEYKLSPKILKDQNKMLKQLTIKNC